MHGEGPKKVRLHVVGPGQVTGSQIELGHDVELMNYPMSYALLMKASIRMEMTIENGKGYVAADLEKSEDQPIGLVPVDAVYSPA